MYAFEGFVYDLEGCKSASQITSDFKSMKSLGARVVMPTLYCASNDNINYYASIISAASTAGLWIMPLVWTLPLGTGNTFQNSVVPRINYITQAVINNPGPVLAVALGDEPLYDWDFGSPQSLATYILAMKQNFQNAGLSIPVSISDMAYGWQQAGDTSSVAAAVDFFMVNNFPYFAWDAGYGSDSTSWSDFTNDMSYFQGIATGRPILVTQTGWPSNEDLYAPNSANVVASVSSEQAYWNLLNGHCGDFFKANNIGWMWRSWDDTMAGWGLKTTSGSSKWSVTVKQTC